MILASQSPRRIELMREAGYDIRVIPADIDETPFDDETPLTLVERLARAKAAAVAAEHAGRGAGIAGGQREHHQAALLDRARGLALAGGDDLAVQGHPFGVHRLVAEALHLNSPAAGTPRPGPP